jgi:hypothetical protein
VEDAVAGVIDAMRRMSSLADGVASAQPIVVDGDGIDAVPALPPAEVIASVT